MTKRMLHENIIFSDKFQKISFGAECFYNRLLTQTDDYGNVRGSIGYLTDVCFPKKKCNKQLSYQQVEIFLSECVKSGLLNEYTVDGIRYLNFNRFQDFQDLRVGRIRKTSIPSYSSLRANAGQMPAKPPHELELELELETNTCSDKPEQYRVSKFDILWTQYPPDRRSGKEKCLAVYKEYCKSEKDEDDFINAFLNYSKSKDFRGGFIKLSTKWFKDWKVWIDYVPVNKIQDPMEARYANYK